MVSSTWNEQCSAVHWCLPSHHPHQRKNLATTITRKMASTLTSLTLSYLLRLFSLHQRHHRYVTLFGYLLMTPTLWQTCCLVIFYYCGPLCSCPFLLSSAHNLSGPGRWFFSHLGIIKQTITVGVFTSWSSSATTAWEAWVAFTMDLAFDPFLQTNIVPENYQKMTIPSRWNWADITKGPLLKCSLH